MIAEIATDPPTRVVRMPSRALGLDPGKVTGWGAVEIAGSRERVLAFGVLEEADPVAHLRELLRSYRMDIVGVEIVERVHPVVRSGINGISTDQALALYRAGLLAGEFRAEVRAFGLEPRAVSAERWRAALAGRDTASNAQIEQALRLRLADFPAPRRSNNHERDGIGVALFALLEARLRAAAPRRSPCPCGANPCTDGSPLLGSRHVSTMGPAGVSSGYWTPPFGAKR